jgi:hypothetical protein
MSGLAETLRALIKTRVVACSVGPCFAFTKNWTDKNTFEDEAVLNGRVNFWMITIGEEERSQALFGATNVLRKISIVVHGYAAYDEDGVAEALLADQSETVMDALDADTAIHTEFKTSGYGVYEAAPAQRGAVEQVEFRAGIGYLLNHTEITQQVTLQPL